MDHRAASGFLGLVWGAAACTAEVTEARRAAEEPEVYGAVADGLGGNPLRIRDRTEDFGFSAEYLYELPYPSDIDWDAFRHALDDLEGVGPQTGPMPRPVGTYKDLELVSPGGDCASVGDASAEDCDGFLSFSRVGFDPHLGQAVVIAGDFWSGATYALVRDGARWDVLGSEMAWVVD